MDMDQLSLQSLPVESTLQQHHSSSSSSSSSSSLSRNVSFSKLNAQAPEFVPTRPHTPPPPPPAAVLRLYPPPPPPPTTPFPIPIHGPLPHAVPVLNHRHPHHHHNQHQHQQQYAPVRNHNNNNHHHQHHHQNAHYVPVHYHPTHHGPGSSKVQSGEQKEEAESEDVVTTKDVIISDHASSKSEKNGKYGLSDEATQKLLNQVEYYFSDLNLATTDHLMRFINKDPEGYVPLSVVAAFKKIKAAINSNSHLAMILRNSSKLVVSEDGKKVRRVHPLTEADVEELQSHIVVAENLPKDHCHQNLMKIFSSVGRVKTIRTCPPQTSGAGASSASRSAKADGLHFSNKLHAFVEYESVEIAEKAVAELNDEGNWRSGLRLWLMLKHTSKDLKPTQVRGKKGHDGQGQPEEDEVSTSEQQFNERNMDDHSQQCDVHLHEQSIAAEDHANDKEIAQKKGRNRGRGKGRGRGQYHHNNRGNHVGTPPSNNQVIGEQASTVKQPPGPRMPDGTRGFAVGRGKPVAVVNIA